MYEIHEIGSFSNTPPDTNASNHLIQVPSNKGLKIAALVAKMTATGGAADFTYDDISEMSVTGDGSDIVGQISGAEMKALNDYNVIPHNSNYLMIPFFDPNAATPAGILAGCLDTAANKIDSINWKIALSGDQDATDFELECFVLTVDKKAAGTEKMFRAILPNDQTMSTIHDTLKVPFGRNRGKDDAKRGIYLDNRVRQVHIKHANMTHFEARDQDGELEAKRPIEDYAFVQDVFRTGVAGWFTWDAIRSSISGDAKRTSEEIELKSTHSAGEDVRILSDLYAASFAAI